MAVPFVLLPGMDGTGELFAAFLRELPQALAPMVLAYPTTKAMDYTALLAWILPQLPPGPFVVLGESFSGPLALMIAGVLPDRVRAVVLVASFSEAPLARGLRALVPVVAKLALVVAPPGLAVRLVLAGLDAPLNVVEQVRAAIRSVSREVLAARLIAVAGLESVPSPHAPILDISGRRDRLVASWPRRGLGPRSCVVLDAPHLILQREPQAAAMAVLHFLATHGIVKSPMPSRDSTAS